MDARGKKQAEVVEHFLNQGLLRSTMVLGTGFGKSKVIIDIIKAEMPARTLILVNSTDLRDNNWKEEFIKWDMEKYYEESVEMVTYQTAYKWDPSEKTLTNVFIIADEVDFAAGTEEYSKFFDKYPMNKTLGVTGYVNADKKLWFDIFMPITYVYTTGDAQDDNLLNQVHFVFVKYELSREKDVKVEYKKDGEMAYFMNSENSIYDYQNKKFLALVKEQGMLRQREHEYSPDEYKQLYDKLQSQIRFTIKNRNDVLLKSNTSVKVTKEIVSNILNENQNNKVAIFSVLTEQSAKITPHVYNGKEKSAVNSETFSNFNSSKIRELGVCSKVNRGVNFTGLNTAIFESFYSSDTDMQQRLGRLTRLYRGDVATAYVLLPYFREKRGDEWVLSETQQVKWARKALAGIKGIKERSTVIDKIYK